MTPDLDIDRRLNSARGRRFHTSAPWEQHEVDLLYKYRTELPTLVGAKQSFTEIGRIIVKKWSADESDVRIFLKDRGVAISNIEVRNFKVIRNWYCETASALKRGI